MRKSRRLKLKLQNKFAALLRSKPKSEAEFQRNKKDIQRIESILRKVKV